MALNTVFGGTYTFRDSQGRTAVDRLFFFFDNAVQGPDTTMANLRANILPLTNASVRGNLQTPTSPTYGVNAEFPSAQDKAVFFFTTTAGGIHRYQIAAPKLVIFLADGITVNPANGLVTAYVASMLGNAAQVVSDRNGNPLTAFVAGFRQRRRLPRRTNIFVLNPEATAPEE